MMSLLPAIERILAMLNSGYGKCKFHDKGEEKNRLCARVLF